MCRVASFLKCLKPVFLTLIKDLHAVPYDFASENILRECWLALKHNRVARVKYLLYVLHMSFMIW